MTSAYKLLNKVSVLPWEIPSVDYTKKMKEGVSLCGAETGLEGGVIIIPKDLRITFNGSNPQRSQYSKGFGTLIASIYSSAY